MGKQAMQGATPQDCLHLHQVVICHNKQGSIIPTFRTVPMVPTGFHTALPVVEPEEEEGFPSSQSQKRLFQIVPQSAPFSPSEDMLAHAAGGNSEAGHIEGFPMSQSQKHSASDDVFASDSADEFPTSQSQFRLFRFPHSTQQIAMSPSHESAYSSKATGPDGDPKAAGSCSLPHSLRGRASPQSWMGSKSSRSGSSKSSRTKSSKSSRTKSARPSRTRPLTLSPLGPKLSAAATCPPQREPACEPSGQQSTLEKAREAMGVKELHHWCAAVSVLMALLFISDFSSHQFRSVPRPSEWGVPLLLLLAWAGAAVVSMFAWLRPYAAYGLAVGSLLATCQLAWHWDSHVAHIKDTLRVDSPAGRGLCDATASGDRSALCGSFYGLSFGASGLDFLDSAAFFIVMFQNCLQSSFLCRLGLRMTAAVSTLQWAVFVAWPFVSPDLNPAWLCRILAPGLWTALQIRASYMWESELKQQAQLIDDLQHAVARSRRAHREAQTADGALSCLLKDTMEEAAACIASRQSAEGDDDWALSRASDLLFRGAWWCRLRDVALQVVAGRYETFPTTVDLRDFARDFLRGRNNVGLSCPSTTAQLDPLATNLMLDAAVVNAILHGHPEDPQVRTCRAAGALGAQPAKGKAGFAGRYGARLGDQGHLVGRGQWASLPMERKGSRKGQGQVVRGQFALPA